MRESPSSFLTLTTCHICHSSCSKCQQYSPTESNKAFDKAANRRSDVAFEPHTVLEELQRGLQAPPRAKEDYLKTYIEV